MTSWEYKVMKTDKHFWTGKDKTDPELFLSDLGRDGWELVFSSTFISSRWGDYNKFTILF